MIAECAEIGVLFDEAERFGVRFHKVPRALFDLIPGEAREITASQYPLWVKTMILASAPGKHIEMTMYCSEPLLREHQPEIETGMDAPAD